MPYVTRDENNIIVGVFARQQTENQEWIDDDDPELQLYRILEPRQPSRHIYLPE